MSDMYKAIIDLCTQKGISGYRLCKDCGIQPSLLTDLKMGRQKSLSVKNAQKVAEYFNIPVERLLGQSHEKAPADVSVSERWHASYEKLSPENQAVIEDLILKLLKSQSGE